MQADEGLEGQQDPELQEPELQEPELQQPGQRLSKHSDPANQTRSMDGAKHQAPEHRHPGSDEEEDAETAPPVPRLTRWIPSALLDLPPLEPVFALRTPHRVCLQAMPSSRDALRRLLQNRPFQICLEIETDEAPLRHAPIRDVHATRLAPDLPLDWNQYYWIIDGLQDDLAAAPEDPSAALVRGRRRLAVAENTLRELQRGTSCAAWQLEEGWTDKQKEPQALPSAMDPLQTTQQYVRGLTGHLVEHTASRAFADWMADLLREAERQPSFSLPVLTAAESELLGTYLQHRLLGNAALTSPAGVLAGWHLLLSATLLGLWYAGLLVHADYESELEGGLVASLWTLDQGFWCDETLVHDVLRSLNVSEYTSPDLAFALTAAMSAAHARM